MSTSVDNQIVQMQFDNQKFEQNMAQTQSSLGKFKDSLNFKNSTQGFSDISKAAEKVNFNPLNSAVEGIKVKFTAMEIIAITALTNITNQAVNAGKRIASALTIDPIKTGFAEYETQINSVQTILANTSSKGTTLGQVNEALDELNTYADRTIYNFTEMTRNIGTFTAAGVDLDTSVEAIKGIANLAAVSGSNSQQASTAMYQLSQALATGTIRLMDWNSVVNAGMGGQVFQDALKETARNHGIAIDQIIDDNGSFRESLQEGWLSSDILTDTLAKFTGDLSKQQILSMGYTEEQAESILKLGVTANDAATKVKTLTQLFDTLKESAQSGWSQSWRIIVGDFEEAKEVFTEVSEAIGGIIGASADARNEMLLGGLSSSWDQFISNGVSDEEALIENIKVVAKEYGIEADKIITEAGSFSKAIKEGWLSADILTESVDRMTKSLSEGLSEDDPDYDKIVALQKLNEEIKSGIVNVSDFTSLMTRTTGREYLIDSFRNSFQALSKIIAPISEAFRNIFPKTTGDELYNITKAINEFTEKLIISDETAEKIKNTFSGLFSILDIVKQAFLAVFNGIKKLLPTGLGLADMFLTITSNIGENITAFAKYLKEIDLFNNVINFVVSVIKDLVYWFEVFLNILAKKIVLPGLEFLKSILQGLYHSFVGISEVATNMKKSVVDAFSEIGEAAESNPILSFLSSLWNIITSVGDAIFSLIGGGLSYLFDALKNLNMESVFSTINAFLTGGALISLKKFFDSFSGIGESLKGMSDNIALTLDAVRGSLEAYQSKLKAETLKTIAIAIAILAASVLVMSFIDPDKITSSLGAVTVLLIELMGSLALFNKFGLVSKGMIKTSAAMVIIATAISVLASALVKVASVDSDKLIGAVAAIAALSAVMIASTKILGSGSKTIIKGSVQMIIFAQAINVLANAVIKLSTIDFKSMIKGLVGVGILFAQISLFLNNTKLKGSSIFTATSMLILSYALVVLSDAVKNFSELSWEDLAKGMTAVSLLLAALAIFSKTTGNAKHIISTGLSMILIASSIKILASALTDMSRLSWEEIGKSLTALAGSLAAITIAVNLMPKNMVATGTGLILIGTALLIVAQAVKVFSGFSWEEIAKGLTALGGSMAILAIGLNSMKGALLGAAALVVATGAILLLVPALVILGAMSWESIAKGLTAIAGAFAILGISAAVLSGLIVPMLALSGALLLISASALLLGAGFFLVGAGLSSVAVGIAALGVSLATGAGAIAAGLATIVLELVKLVPEVATELAKGIVIFAKVIADGAPIIGDAIKKVLLSLIDIIVDVAPKLADGALKVVDEILKSLVEYTPSIINSIMLFIIGVIDGIAQHIPALIESLVGLFQALFDGVVNVLKGMDPKQLTDLLLTFGMFSGLMLVLSSVATLVPMAMVGVLGLGLVIAELAIVLAAIGALAQIPGLDWLISEGGQLMATIGEAIGGFIGSIVGGFLSGVSSSFPKIGQDLADFMTNVDPFIKGAKQIDSKVLTGVKELAGVILTLTGASLLEGITSWFTGGNSFGQFAEDIAKMGPSLKTFANDTKSLDTKSVLNAALAIQALAETSAKVPNSGGLVSLFTGENDFGTFIEEVAQLGPALKTFEKETRGLDTESVKMAADATLAVANMASELPNTGGVAGWFMGENNLSTFGEEMSKFAPHLKTFARDVAGIDPNVVTNSALAAEALAKMAVELPNSGGIVSWFTGENLLSSFGTELALFGPEFKRYYDSISGISPEVVSASSNAALALSELANNLPNSGGMVSWFTGDNDLEDFGKNLSMFGEHFALFYSYIREIKPDVVTATSAAAQALANLQAGLADDGGVMSNQQSLNEFGRSISSFGGSMMEFGNKIGNVDTDKMAQVIVQVNKLLSSIRTVSESDLASITMLSQTLDSFAKFAADGMNLSITDNSELIIGTASTMIDLFIQGLNDNSENFKQSVYAIITNVISTLDGNQTSFYASGASLMEEFRLGVVSYDSILVSTYRSTITTILDTISSYQFSFYKSGQNFATWLQTGLNVTKYNLFNTFRSMMATLVMIIGEYQNQFHSSGENLAIGISNGIRAKLNSVVAAARQMAQAAVDAVNETMGVNSPATEGISSGGFLTEGVGIGMLSNLSKLKSAAKTVVETTTGALKKGFSGTNDLVLAGLDSTPTIKPVMDLSNVSKGFKTIDAEFSRVNASTISVGNNAIGESSQNGSSGGSYVSYTQNNYSPKALSRIDIYRQTKTLISNMRGRT